MRFSVDNEFPGPPADVVAIWLDPKFHEQLDLPDLSRPDVLEASTTGTTSLVKLRYEFTGHIDPIAKKVLGNRKLTWLQELHFDMATLRGTLTFAAEADPKRLNGEANVTLQSGSDDTTRRHIEGDLHVRVPLIGGKAERSIVPGIVRRLDVEAAALAEALKARE
jgi:uncharacterized protein DUF2505